MHSCKVYMIEKLIFHHIISKEDTEIYVFGLECLLLKLIHCISYLLIAICLNMVPQLILIGCIFIPLRRSAGGYHARTKTGCYVFSCFYVFVALFLVNASNKEYLWWGGVFISNGMIFFMSPMDNENKRLDRIETVYYRKKTRYLLVIDDVICIFLIVFHFQMLGSLVRCGICGAACLLLIQKVGRAIESNWSSVFLD